MEKQGNNGVVKQQTIVRLADTTFVMYPIRSPNKSDHTSTSQDKPTIITTMVVQCAWNASFVGELPGFPPLSSAAQTYAVVCVHTNAQLFSRSVGIGHCTRRSLNADSI